MANRDLDWFRQAEADLQHARHALEDEDFEWSCFAAQQAAEKALKAVFQKLGMEAWGHVVTVLVGNLPASAQPPPGLVRNAKMLDKHFFLTRDPSSFECGAPTDYYTVEEAENAIRCAREIVEFCGDQIR